jgi:hypothetical protein
MELPSEDSIRWVVRRYAELRAAHGDVIGAPELLEPTGRHFPDEFKKDAPSVARLLRRMMSYAPLAEDLPIALAFVEPEEQAGGGGCSSGGCGTGAKIGAHDGVVEMDEGYRVELKVTDVANPMVLTTSLARSVGALVLAEAGEQIDARDAGATSEIAATVCGFGVLLVGGAAVYTKACGGLRMHCATQLPLEDLAVALALFVRVHELKPSAARAHLETTQREAFDEAMRWVDSNDAIVTALRDRPAELTDGLFTIEPPRAFAGLLGRFFGRKRDDGPDVAPVSKKTERTEAEARRIAEARALVEEALRGD